MLDDGVIVRPVANYGMSRHLREPWALGGALEQLGADSDEERQRVLVALRQRDKRDRTRAVAPLAPAADAVTVDSTAILANAVVAECWPSPTNGAPARRQRHEAP